VITSNDIATVTEERNFNFYTTHANDPLPAAVGLMVLQTVLDGNLAERSRVAGAKLRAGLQRSMERYGCIGAIRGRALMIGVEIVSDRETKAAAIDFGKKLSASMMELGLSATISARTTFSGCIRIAPPLIISDEEIDTGLSIFEEALRTTPGSMPLY
jgi:4-aminobutyrate aminotransferase-like enzyme